MKKIILLTGGGNLPVEVSKFLKKKNIQLFCIGFKNNPLSREIFNCSHKIINFGEVVTELKRLNLKGFNKVILIGNLKRPKIKEIKPDINAIKLIPEFSKVLFEGGDNKLINFVTIQLKKLGFNILDLRKLIPEFFLGKGNHTNINISKYNMHDIKKGELILNGISKYDIGQSIIVQNGNVIGIEAAQGTDGLIKFSNSIIKKDQQAILIKLAKVKQNLKVDLPTIGINTVKNCKKYNIKGIAFSSGKTLFLKKEKIIDYCNLNNIFLVGV